MVLACDWVCSLWGKAIAGYSTSTEAYQELCNLRPCWELAATLCARTHTALLT